MRQTNACERLVRPDGRPRTKDMLPKLALFNVASIRLGPVDCHRTGNGPHYVRDLIVTDGEGEEIILKLFGDSVDAITPFEPVADVPTEIMLPEQLRHRGAADVLNVL